MMLRVHIKLLCHKRCIRLYNNPSKLWRNPMKNEILILSANCFTLCNISRENFIPLEKLYKCRREEARRSVLVEVPCEENLIPLQSLCSRIGKIKNMFKFKQSLEKPNWISLIEFENEEALNEILRKSQTNSNLSSVSEAIRLPFLKLKDNRQLDSTHLTSDAQSLPIHASEETSDEDLIKHLRENCVSVSDQIQYYYDHRKMSEIGWRLRFIACRKIEWVLPGFLSHGRVVPFGSSINTFGKRDCDLDMLIDLSPEEGESQREDFPLSVQFADVTISGKDEVKNKLQLIAQSIKFYMPGFNRVTRILNAKVPIVKCNETLTGLDCDISIGGKSGFYMSELLYLYGCCDARVRPLVFVVRWWAKATRVTRKEHPGMWFSNFSTSLLVLFFLMNRTPPTPVIPPLSLLQELSERSFTCEGITYSFVRDATRLPLSANNESLENLLVGFFEFYANFDFKRNAISVITGTTFPKPNFSPLYIQNPIENELNVSRNVIKKELQTFRKECNHALNLLTDSAIKSKSEDSDPWGLVSVCEGSVSANDEEMKRRRSSLAFDVDITSLFERKMSRPTCPSFTERRESALDGESGSGSPTMKQETNRMKHTGPLISLKHRLKDVK